ncbi:MAG: hypothetical protein A2087_06350 [Spirochaetes bacterium GWD1_61_31]|nr:MAG: hypothetical protein A2Y37_06080 [Spirochaetes bacterium GWB1_60_80]OHD35167.1 MAG: hypothetical protein A2004_09045 [Spirochaetes bacterium GWC1_61_12]OHD43078.1 MAG: hypothetical protein A2Y35_01535 [Spirochaetes bacterium GWE1_60_18]OHD43524.1 MAG: hypothetical protein A2087_06350 [Spirochaetes bacterium GWD1_61_31]OHD59673.1 MAG: hypothetical protein A2Y32_12410 [Spirochaetes bacterium GWF1_60_12]HAP44097.1 hypothetical protein [Spirochaetaceae bacterium]
MTKRISLVLVRFSLGAFFVILGLYGILPSLEESIFTFPGNYRTLEVVFGIAELLCGIYILSGVFIRIKQNTTFIATLAVLLVWLARIALTKVVWGIVINDSGVFFRPSFSIWLLGLACELVIVSAVHALMKAYDK